MAGRRVTENTTLDVGRSGSKRRQGRPADMSTLQDIEKLPGARYTDKRELITKIKSGLPFSDFDLLRKVSGLSSELIAHLVGITPRTLIRRRTSGRLKPDESDRLVRVSRLIASALNLFEQDAGAAQRWLSSRQPALGGDKPLALVRTEVGAREVEDLIGRLEHGVFS